MSDLISKQAVITYLKNQKEEIEAVKGSDRDCYLVLKVIEIFQGFIERQPIAYDAEKVAEQLLNKEGKRNRERRLQDKE